MQHKIIGNESLGIETTSSTIGGLFSLLGTMQVLEGDFR